MDANGNQVEAAPTVTASAQALAYLNAATAIGQALATDAATIAGGIGGTKVAGHITGALATFQTLGPAVGDIEQLAAGLFGFFAHLAASHVAAKQGSAS